jgi:hypothetical protein
MLKDRILGDVIIRLLDGSAQSAGAHIGITHTIAGGDVAGSPSS